jgi:hypothetical protein
LTNHYNFRQKNSPQAAFRKSNSRYAALRKVTRLAVLIVFLLIGYGSVLSYAAKSPASAAQRTARSAAIVPDSPPLIIDTNSLSGTHPKAEYTEQLHAHGGAPPYQWKLESGNLPPGLTLDDDGRLHGTPVRTGEFHFSISAHDGSRPQQAVQREYTLNVAGAISMDWLSAPHVTGNRIDGSVKVTNTTNDDLDFTFVVLAVADNGRATAIGYQRFPLKKGTVDFEIPFGETLAHGAYVVHVDGVGEIADKNEIHRARLQTPVALQVVAGP